MGKLKLTSPAFKHNSDMPKQYTCQGENISPPLKISGVPNNAVSLVLIMTDPDVPIPKLIFPHWVICHMDPDTKAIEEGSKLENAVVGRNGAFQNKYMGPCPPWGKHRYIFKLYALDEKLSLDRKSGRKKVLKVMRDHIIEEAELIGLYEKIKEKK
ncbi:MAG: YbhB/YbcL family Raf kinase inhibitor-like protein [Asgard group archaeon]|nr:YbhB/YbcL family Raf kinase inhibitor-like protein [Asgard group archaeon]